MLASRECGRPADVRPVVTGHRAGAASHQAWPGPGLGSQRAPL